MPISPARAAAFDVLLRVEQTDAYASDLLHSSQYAELSRPDHGLATEIIMGVLRWRSVLDARTAEASSQKLEKLDPEVLIALRMAAYQMMFLSRVPQRAAVHESVELVKRARKRSAVPFVNAVLRKLADHTSGAAQKTKASSSNEVADANAHPGWLVERWVSEYSLATAQGICTYDQRPPATTVRMTSPEVEAELKKSGIELTPGNFLASARQVSSGDITATTAWREGRVSIQDEASQLVALLVGQGKEILDCCAAPGGKTRVLAEQNPQASVTAVELHPHRARLLRKLVRAGNVEVIEKDIVDLPAGKAFDRVLADVPCSGTGTLARNPEIKWRLRPEDLIALHARQVAILRAAAGQMAAGGRLVYSTCSLEAEENSQVVEEVLAHDRSLTLLECKDELRRLQSDGTLVWKELDWLLRGPFLRTIPGVHPCDGFFAAILEKR